jgi:hypothetical protein
VNDMLFIPFSDSTSFPDSALLLFVGSDKPTWTEIVEAFKLWSEENVIPPQFIVLADKDCADTLVADATNSPNAIDVVSKLCHPSVFSYGPDGVVTRVFGDDTSEVDGRADIVVPAVESYIRAELKAGNIVAAAPQGFYFSKLSTRYSSHFIRTENLLNCTAAIELLAVRLLSAFNKHCDDLQDTKVRVVVDSMIMWPLAQALISMRRVADPKRRYLIESCRSYEGLQSDSIRSGPAFVIISASTSGGLERELQNRLGPTHVVCRTIIGLDSKVPLADDALAAKKRSHVATIPRTLKGPSALEGLRSVFETDVTEIPPGYEVVRIIGEHFLNQNFKPQGVRLAYRALKDSRKTLLTAIAGARLALVARRRPGNNSFWSVSFDIAKLVDQYCCENDSGKCLLRTWLTNYAVAGDIAVVYPTDTLEKGRPGEGEAKRMADLAAAILREKSPRASIRVMDSGVLDQGETDERKFVLNAGVVVVAPVIGNGFTFKQISASLRTAQPTGPRLYLALASLPESEARLDELKGDLESNADDRAYHFLAHIQLPVGKVDRNLDWRSEQELVDAVIGTCRENSIDFPRELAERSTQFREGNGIGGTLAFLPSYGGAQPRMSPGFLLWRSSPPTSGTDLGAGVLLTVAVFLEACRSAATKGSDTSLVSGLFQQTLIAPSNFTRYNDPAIQAALLRAAYKSELNYAASPEMSSEMQRLIIRLMELHNAPAAEALPEFILAIALKRLVLADRDMPDLLTEARKLPGWLRPLAEQLPDE